MDRQTDRLSLCYKKSRLCFKFQCLLAAEMSRCLDKTLLCSVVLCKNDVKTEGRPWHLSRYTHLRAAAVSLFLPVSNIHAGSGHNSFREGETENAQLVGNFFFCPSVDRQVGTALPQDPSPPAKNMSVESLPGHFADPV